MFLGQIPTRYLGFDGGEVNWIILLVMIVVIVFISVVAKRPKTKAVSAKQSGLPLTAEDVTAKLFQPTNFREGYDQRQVDELLEQTVREFQRLDSERLELQQAIPLGRLVSHTAPVLTPEQVLNSSFSPTKFRNGYSQDEVDDFLTEVAAGLRQRMDENERLRLQASGGTTQYGTGATSN